MNHKPRDKDLEVSKLTWRFWERKYCSSKRQFYWKAKL